MRVATFYDLPGIPIEGSAYPDYVDCSCEFQYGYPSYASWDFGVWDEGYYWWYIYWDVYVPVIEAIDCQSPGCCADAESYTFYWEYYGEIGDEYYVDPY